MIDLDRELWANIEPPKKYEWPVLSGPFYPSERAKYDAKGRMLPMQDCEQPDDLESEILERMK